MFCPDCGKPILLRDVIEEKFDSPAAKEQVCEMQSEGQAVIDNESRELLAVHHTGFIVAEAGQIYRGYPGYPRNPRFQPPFFPAHDRASVAWAAYNLRKILLRWRK